jgi:hypothetical protein
MLDELALRLAESENWLSDLGRERGELENRAIPSAVEVLRGHDAANEIICYLERQRELHKLEREAHGRVWYWRGRYLKAIGDRECASWRVVP